MRISDWTSDVCSSDLAAQWLSVLPEPPHARVLRAASDRAGRIPGPCHADRIDADRTRLPRGAEHRRGSDRSEIGRASCRERVCQYVSISVVHVALQKQKTENTKENLHT